MKNQNSENEYKSSGSTPQPNLNDFGFRATIESASTFGNYNTSGINNMPHGSIQATPQSYCTQGRPVIGLDFSDNGDNSYLMNNHNEYVRNLSFPITTEISNNFMTGVHQLQSNHPQEFDGSFLTLGTKGTTDALSRCHFSGVEGIPMPSPQSNSSNIIDARNCLYPRFNMVGSFSDPLRGVDSQTFLANDQRVVSGASSGFLSNPHFIAELPQNNQRQDFGSVNQLYQGHLAISSIPRGIQFDLPGNGQRVASGVSLRSLSNPHYEFNPGPRGENASLGGINFNYDYQGHSGASSIPRSTQLGLFSNNQQVVSGVSSRFHANPQYVSETPQGDPGPTGEDARLGAINFNYDHQVHSSISSIPRSSQLGLPDYRSISNLRGTHTQPAIGQSQNFYMETVGPHKTGDLTGQGISDFPMTNTNSISQACSASTQPSHMRKYSAGPTILAPVQPPPNSSDFGLHTVQAHDERSSLYQANNTINPPLPRTATQFSQQKTAPRILSRPQRASQFLSQLQTTSRTLSQPQNASQIVSQQRHTPQVLRQLAPPNKMRRTQNVRRRPPRTSSSTPIHHIEHIKWQDESETCKRIGHKCFVCKRDLSLSADGSIFRSKLLPPSAILPCGHTFHDHCLKLNTPPDQAFNPPCIHCSIYLNKNYGGLQIL